ncbi:MAG: DUF4357 domain-containing protein [Clostridia bacterium]|nr:DUF4357 domain-containing protein [Clostridia bacterium]
MMTDLHMEMPTANFDGPVTMNSSSHFYMVRAQRSDVPLYSDELDKPGVYLLLVGTSSVYVGESSLDTVKQRIFNTHTGTIDTSWHTVLGFMSNKQLSTNELRFLENAMCEYVRERYDCLTSSPSPSACNAKYRREHYGLGSGQIRACYNYLDDMKHYIELLQNNVFYGLPPFTGDEQPAPAQSTSSPAEEQLPPAEEQLTPVTEGSEAVDDQPEKTEQQWGVFHHRNAARDSEGQARILIHCGHQDRRKAVLLAGSRVSTVVATGYEKIAELRQTLEAQGKLMDRVLQEDLVFTSQTAAAQFLDGQSINGNKAWRTVDGGVLLKELL